MTNSFTRKQTAGIATAIFVLAFASFQAGRATINLAHAERASIDLRPSVIESRSNEASATAEKHGNAIMQNIATVPFSELYDILREASPEQLLRWAGDLEQMPKGPHRTAAVTSFYKSLVQVNTTVTVQAILAAEDLAVRDLAITAVLKAAPESSWKELEAMMTRLPHPSRGNYQDDILIKLARADPLAVSKLIESNPIGAEDEGPYYLLSSWAAIDPVLARRWMETDEARKTKPAIRGLLEGWELVDRAGAMNYALANARNESFTPAIQELAYTLLRKSAGEATSLVLGLPADSAKAVIEFVIEQSRAVILHAPEDYQRPPDEVTRWIATLPMEYWKHRIGVMAGDWFQVDVDSASAWLGQLPTQARDNVVADFCRFGDLESAQRFINLGFTITDARLRQEALASFARRLGETRGEALGAVSKLPLTREQLSYLRKVMP